MKTKFLYGDITGDILGAFYKVLAQDNSEGLKEEALTNALAIELQERGRKTRREVSVTHRYKSKTIGSGRIDLLVANKVIVEVKKLKALRNSDSKQLEAYMESGHYAVGLLLNFNKDNPQQKRLDKPNFAPKSSLRKTLPAQNTSAE